MDEDDKTEIFVLLILLVGVFPSLGFILVWFIKNVMTPIGEIEDLAWPLSSPKPFGGSFSGGRPVDIRETGT